MSSLQVITDVQMRSLIKPESENVLFWVIFIKVS